MPIAITPDLITAIAKVCHEANRAWCEISQDFTQPHWEMAPDWQKSSCRDGVLFHLRDKDAQPSASHDNWLKEKERSGWTYGPEKDTENKKHPCCVPYGQLPTAQQVKDLLFRSIVLALRGMCDESYGTPTGA